MPPNRQSASHYVAEGAGSLKNDKNLEISGFPLAILAAAAQNADTPQCHSFEGAGGLLVSQADQIRADAKLGVQHAHGRPYHFSSPIQDVRIRKIFGLPDKAPLPA